MKKKLYTLALVVSALFGAQTITAQEVDITPAKFKFTEMALGACPELINEGFGGANPPNSYAPASTTTGYLMQGGAPGFYPAQTANIAGALSIVDGGELGNVLMIKGLYSKEERGVAATEKINGWWNLCFYTSNVNFPRNTNVRLSFKIKAVAGQEFAANDAVKVMVQGFQGAGLTVSAEAIYLNDDIWWQYETDFMLSETAGIPPRIKFDFPAGKIDNLALYITDLKLIQNPLGKPDTSEQPDINDTPTSVDNALSDNIKVIGQNGTITVEGHENEAISIYSIAGSTVKQAKETANYYETSMPKGVYLVKVANKTVKVIL
ncbi:MAG: DUF6383 domain-containing protein [Bacteroidales bacterium]